MIQIRLSGPQINVCGILSPSRRRAGTTAFNQGEPEWVVFCQATHAEPFFSALGPFTQTIADLIFPKYH